MVRNGFIVLIGALVLASGLMLSALLGAPDVSGGVLQSALVVLPFVTGIVIMLCAVAMIADEAGKIDIVVRIYRSTISFFSSGVFYIILGCMFLLAAYSALNHVHSAFVFLLAILGVAIVLFGTALRRQAPAIPAP